MRKLEQRGQRGQALVEFALILPVLSVIIFGMIEMGFMLNNHAAVLTAARDGARVAALNCSSETTAQGGSAGTDCKTDWVSQAVTDSTNHLFNCGSVTATVTNQAANAGALDKWAWWQVQVTCTYTPLTPWGTLFRPPGGTISGTVRMRDMQCIPSNLCTG